MRCVHACCKSASIMSPSSIDRWAPQGEFASEEENIRGMRQRTSAGVSVGDRRSPSYTNLSDPTRVKVGGTLVFGKCRGKRTRIFAEAFLKEGYYERVGFTRTE
jgi:hypothetical protein